MIHHTEKMFYFLIQAITKSKIYIPIEYNKPKITTNLLPVKPKIFIPAINRLSDILGMRWEYFWLYSNN